MNTRILWRRPEFAAYVLTTAAALTPVWSASVFPSQDGGAHLYNAHVLAGFLSGTPSAHYADIYTLNFTALANWVDHLVLALLSAAVSPATAEKLLVSAYVLLFAAAARYAAESIRPGHGWVAHLALPLIFTFNVMMGFYNFVLSFPVYFLLLGFYWRHRDGRRSGSLAALLLVLYVLHPLAWLFALLSLTTIVIAAARDTHAHGHTSPRTTTSRLLEVWLAAAPGGVLLLVLVGNEPIELAEWQPFPALLRHVYLGGPLWTFSPVDTAFGAAVFALLAGTSVAAWRSNPGGAAIHALAWTTGAYLVLLVLLPSQWKSLGLITERVGTFAFLTWVVALAGFAYPRPVRTTVIVAAQVLALLLTARWILAIDIIEPYVEEYLSVAPRLEPGRRALELNFATRGRDADGGRLVHPVAPFAHTIGLAGAMRDVVVLNDYEALTAVFPLRHRSAAADLLQSTLHDPPDFRLDDLDRYEQATCRPIDYVVVWQADLRDAHTRELMGMLADRYVPTYTSRPGGYARLLERRGPPPCPWRGSAGILERLQGPEW